MVRQTGPEDAAGIGALSDVVVRVLWRPEGPVLAPHRLPDSFRVMDRSPSILFFHLLHGAVDGPQKSTKKC